MYKNQLQELAQRSCFNLPAYSCIREGPDHAPRFKATVNFNGEIFESPNYCATLRQAEHAAAEVALNVLSKRGPSQSLAAKILDETSVCKNLLQETAQRAGLSLPVYTTIKGGRGHVPVFSCTVAVGGRIFAGEPAKTKKQAEKNAAMAAWSVIKQLTQPPQLADGDEGTSDGRSVLSVCKREDGMQTVPRIQPSHRSYGGRPRVRMVNVRGGNHLHREGSPAGQIQHGFPPISLPSRERSYEAGRFLFNQQPNATSSDLARSAGTHQRRHSLTGIDTSILSQESLPFGKASSDYVSPSPLPRPHQPRQQRSSRLSLQSCSDRIELRRPLMEELQLLEREGDDEWLNGVESMITHLQSQPQHLQKQSLSSALEHGNRRLQHRRALFQSQSERFELKPSLFDELYQRDEEDWWLNRELMQPAGLNERDRAARLEGMFYDRNKGSFSGTENIPYSSGYNNERAGIGTSYRSGFRDAVGSPHGGYLGNVAQYTRYNGESELSSSYTGFGNTSSSSAYGGCSHEGDRDAVGSPHGGYLGNVAQYTHYNGGSELSSSYTGFGNTSSSTAYGGCSQEGDGGPSYGTFNVNPSQASFYNKDVPKKMYCGYPNGSFCSSNVKEEDRTSSSTSIWSHPVQWWTSHLSSSPSSSAASTIAHSRIAPPVRVRQTVAVCAAPPQSKTIDGMATNDQGLHSLHYPTPPDAETSTSELFKHLKL